MAINSGWLDQMRSMADIGKWLDGADKKYDSIEESTKNIAKNNRDAARALNGDSGATTANSSAGTVMNSPGMPQQPTVGTGPGAVVNPGSRGANNQPLQPRVNPGAVVTGDGWEKSPFADVKQFPIIGDLLGKLVEPAKMAYTAMPTVQQSFDYEYLRNRAAFSGMGGLSGSRQDQEESVRALGKSVGQRGIQNSPLDVYEALNQSRNLGSNTAGIGNSLATATSLSPGIGMVDAAGALTGLNSASSVNMLRMIGVNIRDTATGNMRELNKIIEDLWSTLNRQKRGKAPITRNDIRMSLQPGNALDSLLQQYFSGDPLTRKIIEDGLFAKAAGVSDLTSEDQLVNAGVIPDGIKSKSRRDTASGGVIATFTDAIIQGFETANAVARALSGTIETLFSLPGLSHFANIFAGMKGFLDTGVTVGNGVGGTVIDFLSGIPGMAEGGATDARNMYLVGERGPELYVPQAGQQRVIGQGGPELFVPESDGHIIPNHKLNFAGGMHEGGGVTTKAVAGGGHMHPEWDKGTPHKHGTRMYDKSKSLLNGTPAQQAKLREHLIAGGWKTEYDIQNALSIIKHESGGIPDRENFEGPDVSYGLFQINMKNDWSGGKNENMGKNRMAKYGQYGVHNYWDLYDPVKNAKVAWATSSQGRQFEAWSTKHKAGLAGPFGNPRGKNSGVAGWVEGTFNKATDAVGDAAGWVANKATGIFNKVTDTAGIANALKDFLSALTNEFPKQLQLAGVREGGGPVTTGGASGGSGYNINYGGVTIQVTGSGNWDEKKLAQELKKTLDYDNLIRKAAHH
jgi:hypothetical protein